MTPLQMSKESSIINIMFWNKWRLLGPLDEDGLVTVGRGVVVSVDAGDVVVVEVLVMSFWVGSNVNVRGDVHRDHTPKPSPPGTSAGVRVSTAITARRQF
jgi:hypothetical protein